MKCGLKLLWLGLALLAFTPTAVQAATTEGDLDYITKDLPLRTETIGPYYDGSNGEKRMHKLCRGVANVGLCVAEIPNQMFKEVHKTSPVTGILVGGVKGVCRGGERLLIGAWEIATFYHPTGNNYQPYIEPEVVTMEYLH